MSKEQKILNVPSRQTSLSAGIFNLTKSAVGAGILSLPFAMKQAGLIPGLFLIIFASLSTSSTLHFLARIAANTDQGNFFEVGKLAFGTAGEVTAVVSVIFYLIGALIAYASFIKKYMLGFLTYVLQKEENSMLLLNGKFLIGMGALLILPLALLRDMSKLAKASIVGMICMAGVVALTVVDCFRDTAVTAAAEHVYYKASSELVKAFTNILFAFCNHFTMLAIVPTMVDPTPVRRTRMLLGSASAVLAMYLLTAFFGYWHFGENVDRNILLSVNPITLPYAVAMLIVGIVVILSFPLLCDPTKSAVELLVTKMMGPAVGASIYIRNFVITSTLVAISAVVAMFQADNAQAILGVGSSFCGSLLMFVFPSAYFLRLSRKYEVHTSERVIAYFNIVFGLVVMVLGTFFNTHELVASFTKK